MPKETFMRLRGEKQENIMRAAIHEFVENGFDRTRVEDIAAAAGVAKGSIYQYFEDKKDLFIYCSEWGLRVFMDKLDERAHTGNMDIYEYFRESFHKQELLKEEQKLALFMQQVSNERWLAGESMQAMYRVADKYVEQLIRNSQRKGLVRKDIDDGLLKEYFLGVTDRFKKRWLDLYLDFSRDMTKEQSRLMKAELNQMLALLQDGMGTKES